MVEVLTSKPLTDSPQFGGKARAGPQALVALPAETQMAAVAGNSSGLAFPFENYNIANSKSRQMPRGTQSRGTAADDDDIMAFH